MISIVLQHLFFMLFEFKWTSKKPKLTRHKMGKRVAIDAGLNSCFNSTQEESFDFCLNLAFWQIQNCQNG